MRGKAYLPSNRRRQSEARAGSVLGHVTKRIAAITPPRALVVLRFLLNNPQEGVCFWNSLAMAGSILKQTLLPNEMLSNLIRFGITWQVTRRSCSARRSRPTLRRQCTR